MRTFLTVAISGALVLGACSSAGPVTPRSSPPAPAAAGGGKSTAAASVPDWPTYHGNAWRSGYAASMPRASKATRVANLALDGQVYASPIVVNGETIVATENDVVYGLTSSYKQAWKVKLGSPSPSEERQCGDITPLGITGTPAYDAASKSVFLVAETGGSVRHTLYAIDPATGKTRWTRSVDLPGVSARDMQQRGAIAIAHGRAWVAFGAQAGDCGDYKGRVVGVPVTGKGASVSYTPPTTRGGGMWNPAGPSVGPDHDVYVVSANGAAFPGDTYDHTNSVLRLNGNAKLVDSFAPADWAQNNQGDVGLGSQGVTFVSNKWVVLGGKSGPVYTLGKNHLGGVAGAVARRDVCKSYGGAATRGNVIYLPCTDGVRAVRIDLKSGDQKVLWHADSAIQGSPVLGGGKVWTVDANDGVLYGLSAATGAESIKVDVGQTSRFASPAVHGRDVLVPTLTGLAVVRTS